MFNYLCLFKWLLLESKMYIVREKKIEMHFSFVKLLDLWNIGNKKKFEIFAVIQHFD